MLAAESAFEALSKPASDEPIILNDYPKNLKNSWIYQELNEVRNQRPAFAKFGPYAGNQYSNIHQY